MSTTFEIGRQRMADLLQGKEIEQGGTVIRLAVGKSTIQGLLEEAPDDATEDEDVDEGEAEEPAAKRPAKKKATRKKTPAKS